MTLTLLLVSSCLWAEKTSIPGLSYFCLDNGLELFVLENNCAPLAYIEIAVRAGGVTQVPENTGLFHLYEHMMFKGNAKYPDQKAATEALNRMGVSDWNGTTGLNKVNYFFTVPVTQLRNGLEYWSYAIRTPLMDEKEFENEKGVVLSEITADYTDPTHIRSAALSRKLFPQSPWQLDPGGMPETVKNATVAQLKEIQKTYYVPNNAALFVGGAVKADEVYQLVKEIYGDWEKGDSLPPVFVSPKEMEMQKLVYPSPTTSGSYVSAVYYLRGPDGECDLKDVYGGDFWATMVDNPSSEFASILISEKDLNIPDTDYFGAYLSTSRANSLAGFYASMISGGPLNPVQKAEKYLELIQQNIIPSFLNRDAFLTKTELEKARDQMEKDTLFALDSVSGFLQNFSEAWASTGSEFQLTYDKYSRKVSLNDVKKFVEKYLLNKNGLLFVTVSPDVYEAHKDDFEKAGYDVVSSETAFWWVNKEKK